MTTHLAVERPEHTSVSWRATTPARKVLGVRAGRFAAFLALLLSVYFVGIRWSDTIPDGPETALGLAVAVALLLPALIQARLFPEGALWRALHAAFAAEPALLVGRRWHADHVCRCSRSTESACGTRTGRTRP